MAPVYTRDQIQAERIRRANLKTQAIDNAVQQSAQPAQAPEQAFKESPFMSGITGFNTAVERPVQGILQLLTGDNWDALRHTALNREADYARSQAVNPGSTLAGNIIGDIGLSAPLGGPFSSLAAKIAPIAKSSPYLKNIIAGALGGGALGGAQYVEQDESRLGNALQGATIGGGVSAALPGLTRGLGMAARGMSRAVGQPGRMMKDFLDNFTPQEMSLALDKDKAAKRIGAQMTPAEAAENKIAAKVEGRLGTSPEGERNLYEFKKSQKDLEEEAIPKLFKNINPSNSNSYEKIRDMARSIIDKREKALQRKARPHYEAAENVDISPNKLNSLTKDGNINRAFKDVLTDERYAADIEGFSPTSVKVLDEVKKHLDGEIGVAKRAGDKNLARVIRNSKEKLVEALDEASVDYKKARGIYSEESPLIDLLRNRQVGKIAKLDDDKIKQVGNIIFDEGLDNKELSRLATEFNKENPEAWSRIIRNYMENKIATGYVGRTGYHGTNFYNQFLANDKTFNKLQTALADNPKAVQTLKDMKSVFKDITNQPTIKGSAALAKSSLDVPRSSLQAFKTFFSNLTGGYYDKAMVDIITTDKWQKAFEKALKEPTKESKLSKLNDLFDEVVGAGGRATALQQTQTAGPFIETENYEIYD